MHMKKLNKYDQGFGIIEGILIVAIVLLIGIVGLMIFKKIKKANVNSNSSISNSTTKAIPSVQTKIDSKSPEGLKELKVGTLTINFPKTTDPITENKPDIYSTNLDAVVKEFKVEDLRLSVNKTDGFYYNRAFNAPAFCDYQKNNNAFTARSGQYTDTNCSFETVSFSNVSFFKATPGDETSSGVIYMTPTKGKTYMIVVGSNFVSWTDKDSDSKIAQLKADVKINIDNFMNQFVPLNKSLFE